jgi:hypothetical protein
MAIRTEPAYKLVDHPELGALAQLVNALEVAFCGMQGSGREVWLRAIERDATHLAEVARAMQAGAANEVTP